MIGQETGESPSQVLRYIRLTSLIPELLDMLDEGKISFNPAVELSFLSIIEQGWVVDGIEYTLSVSSVSQAKRMKALSQEKQLSPQKINEILNEIKKTDMSRVIFKNSQMYKYFPKYYSTEQMKEEIIELLEKERKRKERQRKREEKRMGTDVYSHIIDDDRRKNSELFEEAFYEKKDLDPSMHAHAAGKTVELPTDVNAELLAKVLSNPEMAALLSTLAKSLEKK